VRRADTVARIGGDELAILLVGTPESQAARVFAKIVAANAAPLAYEGLEIRPTVSLGAAAYPRHARDGETLRKLADDAMYAAKTAGGNRYLFYQG
jgi:diguanylate cyclase (GGDEF)-like protein